MRKTVLTAALLAAFALPAVADDVIRKTDDVVPMSKLDEATTASTRQQSDIAPAAAVRDDMEGGCMHRKNTTLNMM